MISYAAGSIQDGLLPGYPASPSAGAKRSFIRSIWESVYGCASYRGINSPSARIFTIDSSGEVKMKLLELAG